MRRPLIVLAASALALGTLVLLPTAQAANGGIVISEIQYNPASGLDTDEFLELANTSSSAIDMSGWSFAAGVTATLPTGSVVAPGGYFVLSPDPVRFQQLYGFAPDAAYTDKLSNGGELVSLTDGTNVIDQVNYDDASPWPTAPDGNGPSLELRDLSFDNSAAENWGPSTVDNGTPRARNSIDGTAPPPVIKGAVASPTHPAPNQAVTVTATLPAGATATLDYKVMFDPDVKVAFLDDAASPGGAGDGVFAATIPGQSAGRLVRWRIDAALGSTTFSLPVAGDTINYQGLVVQDPALQTQLPVLSWFMDDSVYNDILANHRYDDVSGPAVVAYGDQVIDNVAMRIRGQSTRAAKKVNWKIELPSGHLLDFGSLMPYPVDEFALQSDADPRMIAAWDTVHASGARGLTTFTVRSQRNGQFWSVGKIMETYDNVWRKAQGVDDWALYKGNQGGLTTAATPAALAAQTWNACPLCLPEVYLEKKTRQDEDYTDIWQATQALDKRYSSAQRQWLLQNVNIPEVINYMAVNVILRHQDSNWKNWYFSRDTAGTGRWDMWHWDLNRILLNTTAQKGAFLQPAAGNRLLRAMMADPDLSAMFYRRLRTLADQFLAPGHYENLWDSEANRYLSDWNLDHAKWGGNTPAKARSTFIASVQDRRTVIAQNTAPNGPVPTSQSANPDIVINELQYAPSGGDKAEFIELYNPSATESVDLSGWVLSGVGLTIQPGTVILPHRYVVFVKDNVTFESTYPGTDRFVGGEYPGTLSDTGQTLQLLQGSRVVDQVTYQSTAPWPTAAAGAGPSLELVDPGLDNTLPASWSATSTSGGTPSAPNTR